MILGTASHVGKSLIAAAFCRLLADDGWKVAPFKAQNMALNSFVTRDGGEIGRAQVAQAEAAGIEPETIMNPILLKPAGGVSQVVVEGSPIGVMSAREYYAKKDWLWPRVTASYDRLRSRFEAIVLEGAGSPVEINLMDQDLTNLRMARHADASVVIVADIERGGVFAQIVGTWELMPGEDRRRVVGFLINKFRGDASLLDPGLAFIRERTGVPVLGVLPYREDLQIDQEDSLGVDATASSPHGEPQAGDLDVAVARLPGLSNATDFASLSRMPGVRVRYVESARDLGRPDLIVLPGTKTTVRDLRWLRDVGLAAAVQEEASRRDGPTILGICGGFQMLGMRIDDPLSVESGEKSVAGLGLLDVTTEFAPEKTRHQVSGVVRDGHRPVVGYEIHMGTTSRGGSCGPFAEILRHRSGESLDDGAVSPSGRVFGTYVHGLFDSLPYTEALIDELRARRGLPPIDAPRRQAHQASLAGKYAELAKMLRDHVNLAPIYDAIGPRP